MPFPDAPRVVYGKDTLDNVVCQLRFPALLQIDAETPASFQKAIRSRFPDYSESTGIRLELPAASSEEASLDLLRQAVPAGRNHEFASEDGKWKVNLTRTFIALTSTDYSKWETFRGWLETPWSALEKEYEPSYYTRVGLRYVNVIRRSSLGLRDCPWTELVSQEIGGMLSSERTTAAVRGIQNLQEIAWEGGSEPDCRVTARLLKTLDQDNERCLLLDADFFDNSRSSKEEAEGTLDVFNRRARNLLRALITDKLHDAMEPYPV